MIQEWKIPLQLGKPPYPLIHRPPVLSERGIDGFLHVQCPLIWLHISLVENSGWHKHSEMIIGNYSEVMISDILKVSLFVYILVIQVWNSKIDFNMEALSISCINKHWSQYFNRILFSSTGYLSICPAESRAACTTKAGHIVR